MTRIGVEELLSAALPQRVPRGWVRRHAVSMSSRPSPGISAGQAVGMPSQVRPKRMTPFLRRIVAALERNEEVESCPRCRSVLW